MFWLGAALPILTFLLQKKWPNSRILKSVHWPIFFAGTGNLPPAVGTLLRYPSTLFTTSIAKCTKFCFLDWHQLLDCFCRQFCLQQSESFHCRMMFDRDSELIDLAVFEKSKAAMVGQVQLRSISCTRLWCSHLCRGDILCLSATRR
jgi:hypothetical protein